MTSTQQWQRDRGIAASRTEVKWFAVDLHVTATTIKRALMPAMQEAAAAMVDLLNAHRLEAE